ncbi:MAG: hypothetical protein OEU36_08760 [Gammaproteobacteria bacterium]|nr:hypothetical protein [Gammaproteobacteria bacterium]
MNVSSDASTHTPSRLRGRKFIDLIIVLGAVVICLVTAFWLINNDFVWIYSLCFIICAVAGWALSTSWIRDCFVFLSALLFSLAIAELALSLAEPNDLKSQQNTSRFSKGYSQPLRKNGGDLGYQIYPARAVRSWKTVGNEKLYDVIYTINEDGYRQTPGFTGDEEAEAPIVFYGGSMAFGEGVNDDETLPYYLAAETGWRRPILNLGFSGYGPHQMLRSIELGNPRNFGYDSVAVAVYEGIPDHARRAIGEAWWDPVGPEYELNETGSVQYRGRFTDVSDDYIQVYYRYLQLVKVARRSRVVDWTGNLLFGTKAKDPEESVRLMMAIVDKAAAILEQDYGAEFMVLFWDDETEESSLILEGLAEKEIPTIKVSDLFEVKAFGPAPSEQADYEIPNDGHATAAANRLLAEALMQHLRDQN